MAYREWWLPVVPLKGEVPYYCLEHAYERARELNGMEEVRV